MSIFRFLCFFFIAVFPLHALQHAQDIGKHLIVGLNQFPISDKTVSFLNTYQIAGVIFMSDTYKHPRTVKTAITTLKSKVNHTLLFCIDQEGGRVSRMKHPFFQLPAASELALMDYYQVKALYQTHARELAHSGITVNFSPVVDVNRNANNSVIGSRSYGSDPEHVAYLAQIAIQSYQEAGILPVIKHFPGHGFTQEDSHIRLPEHNNPHHFQHVDLLPFETLISNGAPAVMVNHILYPFLDPLYPASLSSTIIGELLQQQLRFDGLIFTDDLSMGAIRSLYSLKTSIKRAIEAGNDYLLVIESHDRLRTILKNI